MFYLVAYLPKHPLGERMFGVYTSRQSAEAAKAQLSSHQDATVKVYALENSYFNKLISFDEDKQTQRSKL